MHKQYCFSKVHTSFIAVFFFSVFEKLIHIFQCKLKHCTLAVIETACDLISRISHLQVT